MHFTPLLSILPTLLLHLHPTSAKAININHDIHPQADISTVINDLHTIATYLSALTTAVNSFSGGILNALDVQRKESAVESSLTQCTTDVDAIAAFSIADSATITSLVLGLQPNIRSALEGIVTKKPHFVNLGVSNLVAADIGSLHGKTGTLSLALQRKASSADRKTLFDTMKDLDAGFETALGAFRS
ncbi:hydrophobic surface binding protein A-domain-containing protein [Aspergillus taichungensis]|uniref:Hydrophobic surface binding protein A-domain-containing protein n=1 Tax=Aspergillus taichungensis TaxID=482145 RepID=A0A2J5HZ80_9EURO|nr:hydrophobic surface binding protein A-domain-containing protein [Aspergillus taichungensis]